MGHEVQPTLLHPLFLGGQDGRACVVDLQKECPGRRPLAKATSSAAKSSVFGDTTPRFPNRRSLNSTMPSSPGPEASEDLVGGVEHVNALLFEQIGLGTPKHLPLRPLCGRLGRIAGLRFGGSPCPPETGGGLFGCV